MVFIARSFKRTLQLEFERLTGALPDRLTHHVHILEMNVDSFRLKHGKRHIRGDGRPDHDPAD